MNVKITKLNDKAVLPFYASEHAAGMDLSACISEAVTINPRERLVVPTGLAIALPPGYEAQIRGRSGMALKHGVAPANGVGTIDADYRGEIGVILVNTSDDPFTIEPGMRVAQMVIGRYEKITWEEADSLDDTTRGSGGFGSTGH